MTTGEPINLYELESLAEQTLTQSEWDYVAGGATDEITLARTRSVFDHIAPPPSDACGHTRRRSDHHRAR